MSEEKSVLSTTLIELQIEQLSKKVEGLEKIINEFMSKWGPDVQRRRDERDEKWDEMIRVLSIQKRDENG